VKPFYLSSETVLPIKPFYLSSTQLVSLYQGELRYSEVRTLSNVGGGGYGGALHVESS
jgi:hypothetical protein